MSYSLVALDLDDTLLRSTENSPAISEHSSDVIRQLHSSGVTIAICSGRSVSCIKPIVEKYLSPLAPHMVGFNGGVIIDGPSNAIVHRNVLSEIVRNKYIDYAVSKGLLVNVYCPDRGVIFAVPSQGSKAHEMFYKRYARMTGAVYTLADSYDDIPKDVKPPKILVFSDDVDHLYIQLQSLGGDAHIVKGQFFVEVLPVGVCKGAGLAALCDHLDVGLNKVVAFGDGHNDVEFLSLAGLGIAVANASSPAKAVANIVSQYSNDEDAVVFELERLIADQQFHG